VGVRVVDTDGGTRVHEAPGVTPGVEPAVILAPAVRAHEGVGEDAWFGLADVRAPRAAGAGTRPADVAGGLSWAEPTADLTVTTDPADSTVAVHAASEVSDTLRAWVDRSGRRLVEIPPRPHALFQAILRAANGGFTTVKGEYVSGPERLRELMADEVEPAMSADRGLHEVVRIIHKHFASASASAGSAWSALGGEPAEGERAPAEIVDVVHSALQNPDSWPELADELVPFFANRLGLGVRVVAPSGAAVGVYGRGRPVYVMHTDAAGERRWWAAPSIPPQYPFSSRLRSPNQSDPALVYLAHAIEARKSALRAGGVSGYRDDRVVRVLHDARDGWLVHGTRSQPTMADELEPRTALRDPEHLQTTVDALVQTAHESFIGFDEPGAVVTGGLGLGAAMELVKARYPQGISLGPSAVRVEAGAAGRSGSVAGLPADQWVVASLPDLVGVLPPGGAALLLGGGGRSVVVLDLPENQGPRLVEFGVDSVGGTLTGQVAVPTLETVASIAAPENGLALVVDGAGHPVPAGVLSELLGGGQRFESAVGWSPRPALVEVDVVNGRGERIPVSEHIAAWAQRYQAGFARVQPGPNSVFDAVLAAAGGVLHVHGVAATDALQVRRALAEHLRASTTASNTLREIPALRAAFEFAGPERVIAEFLRQAPDGAHAQAVHQQVGKHIESGKAAAFLGKAVGVAGHWEELTQLVALDTLADAAGLGLLAVGPHGRVRLHGDPAAPRLAVARLGSENADRPAWVALVPEQADARPFREAAVDNATSLASRIETGAVPDLTEHQRQTVASEKLTIGRTEAGADSLVHAVLAAAGAVQIDPATLVHTPEQLKQRLAALLLERPDVLDAATREAIEQETAVSQGEDRGSGVEGLIDALADPVNRDAEAIARHLIGAYLGVRLEVLAPDGTTSIHGPEAGRPIKIASTVDDLGESHWVALVPEPHTMEHDQAHDELGRASTDRTADGVQDTQVEATLWDADTFVNQQTGDEVEGDQWRSTSFCATIIVMTPEGPKEVAACVSVAVFTLHSELAEQLGVTMP
jgi:hypothetical protein